MSKNSFSFDVDGHNYRVVAIENSDNYSVVRDKVSTRQISREDLFVGDEVNYNRIINLF